MNNIVSRPPSGRSSGRLTAALAVGLGVGLSALAGTPEVMAQDGPLKIGDRAPMFPEPLPSTGGERPGALKVALEDVLGKKNIVLAFYVADWTGG